MPETWICEKMAMLSAMTAAASMFPGILFATEQEEGNMRCKGSIGGQEGQYCEQHQS